MNSHEYRCLPPEEDPVFEELSPEMDDNQLTVPSAAEIDLLQRRELAVQAVRAFQEVAEVDTQISDLLRLADAEEESVERKKARWALRCIADIGMPDSPVIKAVGEANLYHYVEGVVQYGCARHTYLQLMETFNISAEEVTSLYALRQMIAEEANGTLIRFPNLQKALDKVGLTMQQAAADPDHALASFSAAGFFVNYSNGKIYDQPIFSSNQPADKRKLGRDIDSRKNFSEVVESFEWVREYVQGLGVQEETDE